MSGVERGSLILADISGYTRYLTGVELEHSTDILADLIGAVVEQLRGSFTLAKLEGDAIFAYAADGGDAEGSALVTTIESAYFAFTGRQAVIDRATTCTCEACRLIPTLDLKFVVHHGKYATHEVAGSRELVGSDVIVAHRLLKNSVSDATGLRGYAFFSGECASRYGLDAAALTLRAHDESYDDVGAVPGWVHDLEARWREEQERRVVMVPDDDAKAMVLEWTMPAPPPVVWEHMTSPAKRLEWQADTVDLRQSNPRGTRGVGTTNHCVHGKGSVYEEILDWKPYRYYTERSKTPLGPMLMTFEFSPAGDGDETRVVVRIRPEGGLGQRLMMKAVGKKMMQGFEKGMANLGGILKVRARSADEPAATPG